MPVVSDARTKMYVRLKYRAWDIRNRELNYRRCFGYRERWKGLLREIQCLRGRGWTVGIETYNTVLRRYAGVGKWKLAEETLSDMKANNITPTATSWRHLLNATGRSMSKDPKFLEKVKFIWSNISNHNPTVQDHHSLVRALCLIGKPTLALRVVRKLESHNITVPETFFEPIIRASYRRWKFVLIICKKLWPVQNTITLHSILKAAAWNGKKGSASGIVKHILKREQYLSSRSWALFLRAHIRCKDFDGAIAIWYKISQSLSIDDVTFKEYAQLLILGFKKGCYSSDEVSDLVLSQFNQLRKSHFGKSIHSWGAVSEVLIISNRISTLSSLYSLYLKQVGKPWSPSAVLVKRIIKKFKKLKKKVSIKDSQKPKQLRLPAAV